MKPWIIISGNLVNGFEFFGPFALREEAISWAEENCKGAQWAIDVLVLPYEEAK
jgi:hypothetical protein